MFSLRGKARVALDFVLPRKSNENEDQSLGYFFRKRLGSEVVDNLIEPLLSGIYSGDIDELSLLATFPQFYEVEREYRSLILGMKKTTPTPRQNRSDSEEKRPSAFLTLKNGLESLVKKTAEKLPPHSVRKNSPVHAFVKRGDSGYELRFANDGSEIFDAVIMTTPHKQAQQLLNDYSFMNILRDYPTNSVANVAMAFDASQVDLTKDGTGFVVSRNANYTITACTWTHRKWLHTCPEGQVLLRAYVGKPGQSDIVDANDETIINTVLNDLNKVMTIEGRPHFQIVTRWKEAMPQYTVGHPYRIQAVKTNMAKVLPGVFLAGSSYEGVGIPDCIDQGREAVNEAIAYLK